MPEPGARPGAERSDRSERSDSLERPERGERPLGVIEALTSARDQCPHAAVRENAARALEAVKGGGREALREQAFLVLSTLAGWRGAKAEAVKRALREFLEQSGGGGGR